MNRRRFISSMISLLAGVPALSKTDSSGINPTPLYHLADLLLPPFDGIESARSAGATYLSRPTANHDAMRLMQTLRQIASGDSSGIGNRLVRERELDFATGNTRQLDGWVIARSELAVCIALALIEGSG